MISRCDPGVAVLCGLVTNNSRLPVSVSRNAACPVCLNPIAEAHQAIGRGPRRVRLSADPYVSSIVGPARLSPVRPPRPPHLHIGNGDPH